MFSSAVNRTCGICSKAVTWGHSITGECTHVFHTNCFTNFPNQNNLCMTCGAKWKVISTFQNIQPFAQLPQAFQFSPHPPSASNFSSVSLPSRFNQQQNPFNNMNRRPAIEPEPTQFSDDEALQADITNTNTSSTNKTSASIKAVPEKLAFPASEANSEFAVLVGIKAPVLSDDLQRAPIDLVAVIDVSGSMCGSKLELVKSAVNFVIDNLGSSDRLSLVSFSNRALRVSRLTRMTQEGRELAKKAVDSLFANGGTNIVEGLKKGAQVLEERHHKNPVASIIFLSDGDDTCNTNTYQNSGTAPQYIKLLPGSICPKNNQFQVQQTFPVHAFGFGSDHDPIAMHAIADASNGTFSFIESIVMVQDSFANCIGGLLSVVVQELVVNVKAASHGVEIKSIPSGKYVSTIISNQGTDASIVVGNMYAEEGREFLINLSFPEILIANEETKNKTSLLDITCSYRDVVSNEIVQIEADLVEIKRPKFVSPEDEYVNIEVDRQKNRLLVAESIAEAQRMAEAGKLAEAQALLSETRATLVGTASGKAGDGMCRWLDAEMKEMLDRMGSKQMYEQSGRAFALAGISSHACQRATTRGNMIYGAQPKSSSTASAPVFGSACAAAVGAMAGDGGPLGYGGSTHASTPEFCGYVTPFMAQMVSKSQQVNNAKSTKNNTTATPMDE